MTTEMAYPQISERWLNRHATTSAAEIAAAKALGYVGSDDCAASTSSEGQKTVSSPVLQPEDEVKLRGKYFVLLLINLFELWFVIPMPKKALEYLVIDFHDLAVAGGYDKKLPSRIAGITEAKEPEMFDIREWEINLRIHRWLGDYIFKYKESKIVEHALYL